jgi:hypothetical protein
MNIPVLAELEKLVIEHGSAVIQEKHIALLKEQIGWLEKQKEDLKRENAKLVEDLAKATRDLARYMTPSEYVDWEGVLIKRSPGGGYADSPYCPRCKLPMSAMPPDFGGGLVCNPCEYVAHVSIIGFQEHLRAIRTGPQ